MKKLIYLGLFAASLALGASIAYAAPAKARLTAIKIFDEGSVDAGSASIAIDTAKGECDVSGDTIPEEFHDTLLGLTIDNQYLSTLKVTRFSYTVKNYDGAGNSFTSTRLPPSGSFEIDAKSSGEILVLFLRSDDSGKYFTGSDSPINANLGFRNVTIRVQGKVGRRTVNFSSSTAMSFRDIDRCE